MDMKIINGRAYSQQPPQRLSPDEPFWSWTLIFQLAATILTIYCCAPCIIQKLKRRFTRAKCSWCDKNAKLSEFGKFTCCGVLLCACCLEKFAKSCFEGKLLKLANTVTMYWSIEVGFRVWNAPTAMKNLIGGKFRIWGQKVALMGNIGTDLARLHLMRGWMPLNIATIPAVHLFLAKRSDVMDTSRPSPDLYR